MPDRRRSPRSSSASTCPPTPADAAARMVELIDVARQLWDSWEDRRLRRRPGDRHLRRSREGASDRACRPLLHRARAIERAASRAGPAGDPAIATARRPRRGRASRPVPSSCSPNAPRWPTRRRGAGTGRRSPRSTAGRPTRCASSCASCRSWPIPTRRPTNAPPSSTVLRVGAEALRFVGTPDRFASPDGRMARGRSLRRLRHRARRRCRSISRMSSTRSCPQLRRSGCVHRLPAGRTLRARLGLQRAASRFAA